METIIKVRPSELNVKLLDKIREFIGDNERIDITISLRDQEKTYSDALNQSIKSAGKESNLISFTMEDFMSYTPPPKSGKGGRLLLPLKHLKNTSIGLKPTSK